MRFSSFIIFTAAGLAIAAPITPVTPSNLEKKLTVEPVEVVKRATPDVSSLGALTGAVPGGLPVKRQTPSVDSLGALTGAVPGGLPGGLPVKRQLGGLIPSSSSTDDDSSESPDQEEPKAPKEPKEPGSVTDGTTEIDDGTEEESTSSAASALGGLPIGKRQLDGITGLLDPKPADPAPPADDAAAGEEGSDAPADAEEPKEGEEDAAEEDAPAEEEAAPPADEDSGLGGILKRQLDGLTKGLFPTPDPAPAADAAEDAEEDTTTIKGQTNKADDGTNGANSFDAAEKAAAEPATEEAAPAAEEKTDEAKPAVEAAPAAKNATEPATTPAKKQGLAGLLGM